MWERFREAGARMGFVDQVVTKHYLEGRGFEATKPIWVPKAMAKT